MVLIIWQEGEGCRGVRSASLVTERRVVVSQGYTKRRKTSCKSEKGLFYLVFCEAIFMTTSIIHPCSDIMAQ